MKRRQARGKDLKGDVERVWTDTIEGLFLYLRRYDLLDRCLGACQLSRRIHWDTFDAILDDGTETQK